MIRHFIFIVFLSGLCSSVVIAQHTLDAYVQQALESNIALQEQQYEYEQSLAALKEARRMFFPTVSLEASYRRAEGGRMMEIPFGEIMNPAYDNLDLVNSTLSQVDPAYPDIPVYPDIENYIINFVRETEQETKLQVEMPIFNTAIIQNYKIQNHVVDVEQMSMDIYKRELVKEVKKAYYNYLNAEKVVELYQQALETVQMNVINTESLVTHDKVTPDELYVARAKVVETEKDLLTAESDCRMAKAYFNFLLNRDLSADIEYSDEIIQEEMFFDQEALTSKALQDREELMQLQMYGLITQEKVRLEQGEYLPKIHLGASYGYQDEEYRFNSDTDLGIVGLSLSWNIFSSGQQKARIQHAQIESSINQIKRQEAERQIELELLDTWNSIQTAGKSIELAELELSNYQKTFQMIDMKYQKGMVNQLEYHSAHSNMLNSEIKLNMAQYDYQVKWVELERQTATYEF